MSYHYENPNCVDGSSSNIKVIQVQQPQAAVFTTQGSQSNICVDGYSAQEPPPLENLQLPPPNMSCYQEPPVPRGEVKYVKHEEPVVNKTVVQNFNATNTVVKENTIHHQHNKTVVTNVNRNHWHTQRIVVKDNHFHHHLVNNVIKVNDVHHQKIEQVRGEGKTFQDYKQTQRIEAPNCIREGQLSQCIEEAEMRQQQQQYCQEQQQQQTQSQYQIITSSSSNSSHQRQTNREQHDSQLLSQSFELN